VAALLGFGALGTGIANAIANGEPVPEGEYRFSVKLTMTGIPTSDGGRRDSACSATLIAGDWVITAGHCFRDESGNRVERPVADLTTATVGRADLNGDNGQVAEVVAVRQSAQVTVETVETATIGVTGFAPEPDTSACVFDSGAPYFVERAGRSPLLVSIESDGPSCPHDQVETTARVDNIRSWIRSVIR
jgi:secreted trypsin-like serine protease